MAAFQKTTIAIHVFTIGAWIYLIHEIDKTDKQFQDDLKRINTEIERSYKQIDYASGIAISNLQTMNARLNDLNKSIHERNERIMK